MTEIIHKPINYPTFRSEVRIVNRAEEMIDEIDYLKTLLGKADDNTLKHAWGLVKEIVRSIGDEMPDDIRTLILKSQVTTEDIINAIKRIAKKL
jgi:hypothetical protein